MYEPPSFGACPPGVHNSPEKSTTKTPGLGDHCGRAQGVDTILFVILNIATKYKIPYPLLDPLAPLKPEISDLILALRHVLEVGRSTNT